MIGEGRDVLIDGGRTLMNGNGSDRERRTLYIKDAVGTICIQGGMSSDRGKAASGAIAIAAPRAVVERVNLWIEGEHGMDDGIHGGLLAVSKALSAS